MNPIVATAFAIGVFLSTANTAMRAPARPVTDVYFGTEVVDDYRWLENGDDADVKAWSQSQNAHARKVLDALPDREEIRSRKLQLQSNDTISYFALRWAGGKLFGMKYEPPKEQPLLVAITDPRNLSTERIVLDPNASDSAGPLSLDWYRPSPDGKYVAASLSESGTERGNLHVYGVVSGKEVGEPVLRVSYATAGGSMAWLADSSGFYYTRYPSPGERPATDLDFNTQVYFHRLGTDARSDRYEIGKEFPRIGEIELRTSRDGWALASVADGDGGQLEQFLRHPDGTWSQLTRFDDLIVQAAFAPDHSLLLLSRAQNLRGRILKLALHGARAPTLAEAKLFIAEDAVGAVQSTRGAETIVATSTRVYVTDRIGGPEQVRVFDLKGKSKGKLDLPTTSAVSRIIPVDGDGILYGVTRYDVPDTWFYLGPAKAKPERLPLSMHTTVDLSNMEVTREFATSRDGTKIPFTILHRKGVPLNRTTPTIMTGYGGFGTSEEPAFDVAPRLLLDAGVSWVDTNIRGGGEYGEAWHRAGSLLNKQHSFDDFIACAERLIELGYTAPEHLVIEGSSEGGLLMGAALTQRPDLFKAVVADVGLYDMLRTEQSSNGVFNTTETGSVKNAEQFRALYAYSPYHHVRDGIAYPDALFLIGAVDPRVDTMQSRKMVARLQAAEGGKGMVLLRVSSSDGHGTQTGFSEQVEQDADILAFEFRELGVHLPLRTEH
jgi:prolyl oligopeptidase